MYFFNILEDYTFIVAVYFPLSRDAYSQCSPLPQVLALAFPTYQWSNAELRDLILSSREFMLSSPSRPIFLEIEFLLRFQLSYISSNMYSELYSKYLKLVQLRHRPIRMEVSSVSGDVGCEQWGTPVLCTPAECEPTLTPQHLEIQPLHDFLCVFGEFILVGSLLLSPNP